MTPADGLGSRPAASRACSSNAKLIFSNKPSSPVKIALHGGERRKVLWQHPPLTTRPRDVQDRVEHAAQLGLTRSAQTFDCRHMRFDQRPLCVRQIACVPLSFSLILPTSDFSPHVVPR